MTITIDGKAKGMTINIVSTNEEKPHTCGSCKHTDNDLGMVSLRCQIIYDEAEIAWDAGNKMAMEECDFAKVRSWHECHYNPTRWKLIGPSNTEL